MEGECGKVLGEKFDPFCLHLNVSQVDLDTISKFKDECVFVCPITKLSITRYHESESGSLLKQDKKLLGDHAKTAEDRMEMLNLPRL
jgi:hypothetical protein